MIEVEYTITPLPRLDDTIESVKTSIRPARVKGTHKGTNIDNSISDQLTTTRLRLRRDTATSCFRLAAIHFRSAAAKSAEHIAANDARYRRRPV